MSMNRVQFQAGLSMPEFIRQFGTESPCEVALMLARWPAGFRCPQCGHDRHCVLATKGRKTFQCNACHHQTSIIACTVFQGSNLPLILWFLGIHLIGQAKTGLSALALMRQLGISYPSAWLMHHKLMQAMAEREEGYSLSGPVQIDDAYLGGERSGGKVGRGSENKIPFVAAVSIDSAGHPCRVKLTPPVAGFSTEAIVAWAKSNLAADCRVGLACFAAVSAAGRQHRPIVAGGRKPSDLPEFRWVNTGIGQCQNQSEWRLSCV